MRRVARAQSAAGRDPTRAHPDRPRIGDPNAPFLRFFLTRLSPPSALAVSQVSALASRPRPRAFARPRCVGGASASPRPPLAPPRFASSFGLGSPASRAPWTLDGSDDRTIPGVGKGLNSISDAPKQLSKNRKFSGTRVLGVRDTTLGHPPRVTRTMAAAVALMAWQRPPARVASSPPGWPYAHAPPCAHRHRAPPPPAPRATQLPGRPNLRGAPD